jgi:hypothetical protein
MRRFSFVGISRALLICFWTGISPVISFAQETPKVPDRSGLEISSILQSEIRVLKYEDPLVSYEILRKVRGSKKLEIISISKGDGKRTKRAVSLARTLVLLKGFSTIRALSKIHADTSQKELGKIEIDGFSEEIEPQSYEFYRTEDGKVVLRLDEKESYVVDLPLALFQKAKSFLKESALKNAQTQQ